MKSVNIHIHQTRDLTVYNKEKVSQLFTIPIHIHNLQSITTFYRFSDHQVNIVIFSVETSLCKVHAFQLNIDESRIIVLSQFF